MTDEQALQVTTEHEEINSSIEEFHSDYLQELERQELERPTPEEVQQEEQKQADLEAQETEFQETQIQLLTDIKESNSQIIEVLEVSPDYSESNQEQAILLNNVFDGVNVLIGLCLGVGVAIAFVKGLTN